MRCMPVESTLEATHLPAQGLTATEDVTEEASPLERGDWPRTQFSLWEDYRPIMRRLYMDEKRPLREVMEILEREFDFKATYVYSSRCGNGSISRIRI